MAIEPGLRGPDPESYIRGPSRTNTTVRFALRGRGLVSAGSERVHEITRSVNASYRRLGAARGREALKIDRR